jgi:ribosomal protein L37E
MIYDRKYTDFLRYGSLQHAFQHWRNNWTGQVAHVRVTVCGKYTHHIKAFGHVCDTCGYVNVSSVLKDDQKVEDEIFGRSTAGYTWTHG